MSKQKDVYMHPYLFSASLGDERRANRLFIRREAKRGWYSYQYALWQRQAYR